MYSINTLSSGDHVYYFETTDGLAYTKTPPSGSLNGPHVNYKPTLSFSAEAGYITDGVDPDNGNTNVTFKFKVVYTDLDNQAPASIRLCLDSTCYSMAVDASATAALRDGDYANGEQYVYSNTLADGTHNYYFDTTDGLECALLPSSGNLSGPIVTNTYTPVGLNVVVRPDVNVTITFDQVTAPGIHMLQIPRPVQPFHPVSCTVHHLHTLIYGLLRHLPVRSGCALHMLIRDTLVLAMAERGD